VRRWVVSGPGAINSIRLQRFIDLVSEKEGQETVAQFIAGLPQESRSLLKTLQTTPWVNTDGERAILDALFARFPHFALMESAGRDCLVTALSQTVHTLPGEISTEEALYRVPSFTAGFMTHYRMSVEKLAPGSYTLTMHPANDVFAPDVLFVHGILRGLLGVFGIPQPDMKLKSCPVDVPGLSAEEKSGPTAVISIGLPVTEESSETRVTYDLYAQQVLKESARVLEDNRDLQTAVEYLNIANRELEKTIMINKSELEIARSIQKGFVPQRIPDWNGLVFWVKFFPMSEVSGDFYDYFYLGSAKFGLLACDVSGHGVPAALISAIAKFAFSSHRLDSPSEVLERVNQDMINFVRGEGYLTAFYMIVDNHYNVQYSVAAFPSPVLYRARTGEISFLPGTGTLLGMFPDASTSYQDYGEQLEPGDKVFIYSDGLVEAVNVHGESLGEEGLFAAIRETVGMDVQRSAEHIMGVYNRFIRGSDQKDDLTLITVMVSERLDEFNDCMKEARHAYSAGDLHEACKHLKKAISIFPRQTNALFLLGKYLTLEGSYEEAMDYLRQYNLLKPYNADAYRILGYCAYKLGNLEIASDSFKRSLGLRWENPAVLYNQVQILMKQGHKMEAKKLVEYFVQMAPGHYLLGKLRDKYDL
jgi:serine phosphatase RsbU (regulator of sigma subunit)